MNTKEAIKCLKEYVDCCDNWSISMTKKNALEFENIIDLLKRGEAVRIGQKQ